MNRRDFFKSATAFAAVMGIDPSSIVQSAPIEPAFHSKEWWKQYFRSTTQEYELYSPGEVLTPEKRIEIAKLYKLRYTEPTYIQFRKKEAHTDDQIDSLPDVKGSYHIFRMRYIQQPRESENDIPTTSIELVSTPVLLA